MANLVDFKALQAEQVRHKDVHVKRWGKDVRLQVLSATDLMPLLEGFEALDTDDAAANLEFGVDLLSRCIIDSEGVAVLDNVDGREFLRHEPIGVMQQLLDEAIALNGLNDRDDEKKSE